MDNNLAIQFCFYGKNNKKYSFKNTISTFLKTVICKLKKVKKFQNLLRIV